MANKGDCRRDALNRPSKRTMTKERAQAGIPMAKGRGPGKWRLREELNGYPSPPSLV